MVAVDPSEAMLAEGRRRAGAAGVSVDFQVGVAEHLLFADATFDVCRSERALQWLAEPDVGVGELARVLRPGGSLLVIDSDWRTLAFDLPDDDPGVAVTEAMSRMRGRPATVGGRLLNLFRDRGLVALDVVGAAHVWQRWDPDTEEAPAGLFPLQLVVPQLIGLGFVDRDLGERFLQQVTDAARNDRLSISLTMFAVHGRKPA